VKQLTRLNFGDMEVQSERGNGSTFAFTLPANDMRRILAGFLDCVKAQEVPHNIWMLRIRPRGAVADTAMLRRVISTFCYPMDLVLESPDRQAVIALGSSSEPRAWAARIRQEAARFHRSVTRQEAQELDIETVGPWPVDVEAAKLQASLNAPLLEAVHA
jgi:hypothetical protein